MRLQEIEVRMATIAKEIEADGADLSALETEISALKEERKKIFEEAEKRKALLDDIAGGVGKVIEKVEERQMEKQIELTPENVLESKEYRSAYLKTLMGKPINEVEQRALTTAGNSAGAAVPTTLFGQIIDKLVQVSALFNRVTVTHIAGNVTFAIANAKNDAAFKVEGNDGAAPDDTVAAVSLTGFELIKLVEMSAAAKAMSIDGFEQYIVSEIGRKMSIALENAILNGTGTGQPKGVLAETLTSTTYTKGGLTYKDMLKILAQLPTMYHGNAIVVMPRALFFNDFLGMADNTGKPVVVLDPQAPARYSVLGYPVVISDYMPTDTVVVGDFSFYRMNFSKDIAIESDASVGFRSGKNTYRGLAVVDGKVALAEAFVKATRSAT